jgi:hypothetical protein
MKFGLYGDPDALDQLAERISSRAGEVRQRAADHARRGETARWVSVAAEDYRVRLRQDRVDADRAADELERAARALHAHAREVRETIARIAEAEREAVAWFDRQARGLADRVEQVVEVAGGALKRAVLDVPWSGWPYQPGNLPAPGDRGWLDVGRFMRDRGAF